MYRSLLTGLISLSIATFSIQGQVVAQSRTADFPVVEGIGFIHINTIVGNGVTVNHDVMDLFLTDTSPPRASYMLSIVTTTTSDHSIDVVSREPIMQCAIENKWFKIPSYKSQRFCTLNRYQSISIYMIVLYDL